MFKILSLVFKYIFIIIIYLFIFSIIRLIYLDIRSVNITGREDGSYLKLISKSKGLREYYPLKKELTVGRSNINNVVINDPYISARHLKIERGKDRIFLTDLNSSNGTYINNIRVNDPVELMNGDRIKVGDVEFLFVDRE